MSISAQELIALVGEMTVEERGRLAALLREEKVAPAAAGGGGKPKKEAQPPPEADEDGDAPDASAYRIPAEEVEEGVCVGRRLTVVDKRWKPAIYGESQCGGTVTADGLCAKCVGKRERFAALDAEGNTKTVCHNKSDWTGVVTEEPPPDIHMLGTVWAETKRPIWGAGSAVDAIPASAAASAASAASARSAESLLARQQRRSAMDAEKEERRAANRAAHAAAQAEKEAARLAAKAEKEAAKAAAAAKKAAKAKKPSAEAKEKEE
jgi:hypothetical protein